MMSFLLLVADGCGQSTGTQHSGTLVVTVTAGPTCPVERPGDPACRPRPVNGARLRLDGSSEMTVTTDASGTAREDWIPAGAYRLIAQPVNGLMGTPAPMQIVIIQGETTRTIVSYDTRIR